MKHFKRFSLIFFALLLLVSLVPVFAFAVDPVSAIGLAGAMDAYGMAYGVGTVYDVSSNAGISDSFTGLWDEFSQYQSNNNAALPKVNGVSVNYDDYIEEWQSNYKALHGFTHNSGTFAAWSIDEESAEVFDQFWDWLLTGPAEMVRVDNQFQFDSSQIGDTAVPINVYHVGTGVWGDQPLPLTTSVGSDIMTYGLLAFDPADNYFVSSLDSNTASLFIFCNWTGSKVNFYFVSSAYNQTGYYCINPNYPVSLTTSNLDSSTGLYYSSTTSISRFYDQSKIHVPIYSDFASGMAAAADIIDSGVPANSIGVRAYDDDGVVTLPNPYGQDYTPVPLEIVTTVPWDTTYNPEDDDNGVPIPWTPSAVPGVVDDIADSISAEDYSIEADPNPDPDPDPNPGPGEVFLPFIPVAIPSFNFNLSGIWHYVREWVSSISGWIALMFTIWASLPYAIVVPVYASLVIVIVLGVYRRFFM